MGLITVNMNRQIMKKVYLLLLLFLPFLSAKGQDVSTATFVQQFDLFPNITQANGVAFNAAGTKAFIGGESMSGSGIYQFDLGTAFDVSTASFNSGVSLDLTSQSYVPTDLEFNADGTKLLIMASFFDGVSEFKEEVLLYDLSTGFDLTTAIFNAKLEVTLIEDFTTGIALNDDGTKFFIVGKTNATVFEFSMSTAYDIANASASGNTLSVTNETTTPEAIKFSADGNQLFALYSANAAALEIYVYDLSSPYALTGASYAGIGASPTLDFETVWARGMTFSGESKMYLVGPNSIGSPIAEYDVEVPVSDITPPTLEITAANEITNSTPETVSFTFSEAVSDFDISDISVTNGGTLSNFTAVSATEYTVDLNFADDGSYQITVNENTFSDNAGNLNDQAFNLDFVYDATKPTGFIDGPNTIGSEPITIGVFFTEAITAFNLTDLEVINGSLSNLEGPLPAPDGLPQTWVQYNFSLNADGSGDVIVNLPAGEVSDNAGNTNDLATKTVTYDATPPEITLDELAAYVGSTPELSGTLSENGTVEISINDITYEATVTGLNWSLPETSYTNPLSEGIYDVTIVATDLVGNVGTSENPGILNVDISGPVITYNELITDSQNPQLSGTVTDELSGLASLTVTVNGTTYNPEMVNTDWTLNLTNFEEGSYDVEISAEDIIGNNTTETFSAGLIVDLTPPTVEIVGFDNEVRSEQHTISFKFSEPVTGFEENDVIASNLTIVDFQILDGENANIVIAATDGMEVGTVIGLSIEANTFTDLAGNQNEEGISVSDELGIKYSGGSGTEADPYLISTEQDLRLLSRSPIDWDKYFRQTAHITLNENDPFSPIGTNDITFTGVYDGDFYNVKVKTFNPVYVARVTFITFFDYDGVGLFGNTKDAILKNINFLFDGVTIEGRIGRSYAVGLLAYNSSGTIIENCSSRGQLIIKGDHDSEFNLFGGILGLTRRGLTIRRSFTDVDVTIYNSVAHGGGIIGASGYLGALENGEEVLIQNSYSLSSIRHLEKGLGGIIIGGLVGRGGLQTKIENTYHSGKIQPYETNGVDRAGALFGDYVGDNLNGINLFWDQNITNTQLSVSTLNEGQVSGVSKYSTFDIKIYAKFKELGWDISAKSDNDENTIWKYDPLGYPYLNWQDETFEVFTVSGQVVDENGNPFAGATVELTKHDGGNTFSNKVNTDSQGNFSLQSPSVGFHSIAVKPNNDNYEITYFGNTKNPVYTRQIHYDRSMTIRMVPKVAPQGLDGAGRVKGNVVSANGATRMVTGRMLEGDPLAGVDVSLLRVEDNEVLITVQTDENGEYEITGIPAGEYQLLLNMPGIDVNLEGSTFSMDEEGTPLVVSAAVSEEGVVFNIEEEVLGIKNEISVNVFPNPVREYINIEIPGQASIRVIDINGVVAKEEAFIDVIRLNVSELRSDIYFLEITNAKGKAVKKLVKQ